MRYYVSSGKVSDAQDLRVTLKSDVFAFAVTMWEMASRMHPWHGLGVMAVCAMPPVQACPRMTCGSCVWFRLKLLVDYALQAAASARDCPLARPCRDIRIRCAAKYTLRHYPQRKTLTHLHAACAGCDEGRRAEREASHSAGRTGASNRCAWLTIAGLSLIPILCKAMFPEAFVTLMEECWRTGTVPSSP
jgi:hypothetical protein